LDRNGIPDDDIPNIRAIMAMAAATIATISIVSVREGFACFFLTTPAPRATPPREGNSAALRGVEVAAVLRN
jgi:hypothetical protein